MATVTLTNPIPGTGAVAGLVTGNNTAIQTCLNGGIDNANIAAAGVANIDPLKLASGWTAYTPTWTASGTPPAIGNGSLTGAWTQIGKTASAYFALSAGTTTTFGTGSYSFSLPFTVATAALLITTARCSHSGNIYWTFGTTGTTTTVIFETVGQPAAAVGQLVPFTWANGDTLAASLTVRVA